MQHTRAGRLEDVGGDEKSVTDRGTFARVRVVPHKKRRRWVPTDVCVPN